MATGIPEEAAGVAAGPVGLGPAVLDEVGLAVPTESVCCRTGRFLAVGPYVVWLLPLWLLRPPFRLPGAGLLRAAAGAAAAFGTVLVSEGAGEGGALRLRRYSKYGLTRLRGLPKTGAGTAPPTGADLTRAGGWCGALG